MPETYKPFEEKPSIPPDFKPELLGLKKTEEEKSWFGGTSNKFLEGLKTTGSVILKKIKKSSGVTSKKSEVQKEEVVMSAEDQHRRDVFWSNPETDIIMEYLWAHPDDDYFRRSVDVYIDADCSPEIAIQNLRNKLAFEDFILEREDAYAFPADWSAVDVVRDYIKTLDVYNGAEVQSFYDNLVNRKYYSPEQVVKIMSHKFSGFRDYLEKEKNQIKVESLEDLYALEKYVPEHLRGAFKQDVKKLEENEWYALSDMVSEIKLKYPTIAKALWGEPIDPKELEYKPPEVEVPYYWSEEEVEIDPGREVIAGIESMLQTSEKEAENAASFIDGLIEAVQNDEAVAELEDLQRRIRTISEETLFKIKELGSTRDGWYEHEVTRERWYLKMHQKEQTRAEFLANILYEKLGVKVAKTKLFRMRGNITLGSLEIPGAEGTTTEEQRINPDIRSGFIADAFLGNLDVVGGSRGNIVKGQDGHFYRIGNGQALGFGTKNRKSSLGKTIPELESMLDPKTPIGEVFAGLTEEELKQQAQ